MRTSLRSIVATAALTLILISAGCANMTGFGKFVPDNRARNAFETFEVRPEYRYYITGSDTYPVAILALDKSYSMGNDLWKEVELTPAGIKVMVTDMQLKLLERSGQTWSGFLVIDQTGKQIGILYAYLGLQVTFKVVENNTVVLYGPHDDDQLKVYQERIQK
ncbi:MAG: hypothetical protein EG826_07195 [Deltaproteobacteria bacterium]|nr:hypothetical protein [Deltaproteobacteria bacterium]